MKKRLITTIMALLLAFGSSSQVQAAQPTKSLLPYVNYEDLAHLSIEETYSYEEVLADMQNSGILSENDILRFKISHFNTMSASYTETIRYSKFTMDPYVFWDDFYIFNYELAPVFYCGLLYINGSYEPSKIVSLEGGHIYTGGGSKCIFGGTMFYRLEAGNSFYYGVSGDVYKSGTTTVKVGAKVAVGESSTTNIEVTYSDNLIKNVDFDGRYLSAGLNP